MAAEQLSLDLSAERWPKKPYCSNDPRHGVHIRTLANATRHGHIQPNHPSILWRLPFDLDRPGAAQDWDWRAAPPPSWTTTNPATGHAHACYEIEIPVVRDMANSPAMRLAAAVEHGLGHLLAADPSYAGALIQTPGHEAWLTEVWRPAHYDLTELAEWIPQAVNDRRWTDRRCKPPEDFALGRNVSLFEQLRRWSYKAVRDYWRPGGEAAWRDAVERKAGSINTAFPSPLDPGEVHHTAKSVARWTWKNMTPEGFRAAQSARGKRGGRPRQQDSEQQARPWEALGISRRTYYYRKQRGLL